MVTTMERFWAHTKRRAQPSPLNLGVGVTAHSEADALELIADCFSGIEVERLEFVSDLALLDQRHVVPNMGDHMIRGVWFPRQG